MPHVVHHGVNSAVACLREMNESFKIAVLENRAAHTDAT
jgi:hypothetical protein